MAKLVSPSKKARFTPHGENPGQVFMQPSEDRPWLVEAVSALPHKLQKGQGGGKSSAVEALSSLDHDNSTARFGRWMALVSPSSSNYYTHSKGFQVHVWYTSPSQDFLQQKANKAVIAISHPKWTELTTPPLIALQGTSSLSAQNHPSTSTQGMDSATSVYLYVANPEDGTLFLWKLNTTDLHKPIPPTHRSFVLLPLLSNDGNDEGASQEDASRERISCLQSAPQHLVLIGTTMNRVIWVKQTQTVLKPFTVPFLDPHHASHTTISSGFFSSLFGSRSSSAAIPPMQEGDEDETGETIVRDNCMKKAMFLDHSNDNKDLFATVTRAGHLVVGESQRKDDLVAPGFAQVASVWLRSALGAQLPSNQKLLSVEVLQAAAGSSDNSFSKNKPVVHVIVRTCFAARNKNKNNGSEMQDETPDENETRLYWLRVEEHMVPPDQQTQTQQQPPSQWALTSAAWLDRFHEPERVQVAGMTVADNGVAYVALTRPKADPQNPTVPIVMAHDIDGPLPHLYEVDLEVAVDTTLMGLFRDERSFGCLLAIASGMLLRVECKEATEVAKHDTSLAHPPQQRQQNPRKVDSLLNHLRSTFWEFYQFPERSIVLPPSIRNAERADLDQAILKFCRELQKDASASAVSTTTSIMKRHLLFLEFLSLAGISRNLMNFTKWHLLAIGEEIAAFEAISSTPFLSQYMKKFMETLTTSDVSCWLESVQSAVLQEESVVAFEAFSTVLERALRAATSFREERSQHSYGILGTKPPKVEQLALVPLWMSKPVLQKVLHKQISHWNDRVNDKVASHEALEVVVQAALCSYGNTYAASPSETTRIAYARMQSSAIHLLRKVNGKERDTLAWSLSKEHSYYGGCCQIAHDHRKGANSEYSLIPLFKKFGTQVDIATNLSFAKFVIKWFLDRNLIGEALKLGENCQDDLLMMMNSESRLKPYRWIVSIQRGDYDSAARNLTNEVGEGAEVTLAQAKFNLAVAKLANQVVIQKSASRRDVALDRAKDIENKRELAHCQSKLFPKDDAQNSSLWKAESLLRMALDKIERLKDLESKVETGVIALALCAALDTDSEEQIKSLATDVWYRLIRMDWSKVEKILRTPVAGDKNVVSGVLQDTIFAKLHEESLGGLSGVSLPDVLDRLISDRFQHSPDQIPLQRFLRSYLDAIDKQDKN